MLVLGYFSSLQTVKTMSNLNINRNLPDSGDNVRYSHYTPKTDYKGIALLLTAILAMLTIVWLIIMAVAKAGCYFDGNILCEETTWLFWGYVGILTIVLLPALAAGVTIVWERAISMQFLQWRGVYTHREDARKYVGNIIDVARTSAESEATAGLDTYSPSRSTSPPKDTPVVPLITNEHSDTDISPISLEDL